MKYEIMLSKSDLKKMLTMLTIAEMVSNGYKAEKKRNVAYGWLTQNIIKQAVKKGAKLKLEYNEEKDVYIIQDKLILLEMLTEIEDYNKLTFYNLIANNLTENELKEKYQGKIEKIIEEHGDEYIEIFKKYKLEIEKNGLRNIKMEYVTEKG